MAFSATFALREQPESADEPLALDDPPLPTPEPTATIALDYCGYSYRADCVMQSAINPSFGQRKI